MHRSAIEWSNLLSGKGELVGGKNLTAGFGVLAGDSQAHGVIAGGAEGDVAEGGRRIALARGVLVQGRADIGAVDRELEDAAVVVALPFHLQLVGAGGN